jgi:hypothetical protein
MKLPDWKPNFSAILKYWANSTQQEKIRIPIISFSLLVMVKKLLINVYRSMTTITSPR